MPKRELPYPTAYQLTRITPGRRVARGFLTAFAFFSAFAWGIVVALEVIASLVSLFRVATGAEPLDFWIIYLIGLAVLDVFTGSYQYSGYRAESHDPRLNRRIVIFTALSVVAGSLPFFIDPDFSLTSQPLTLIAAMLVFRGPVILASGLPYLLHHIPWNGNFPPQR